MDKNHVLTNALFRKKLAELTGEDIAQTPHFNDFQALDGSTFKTEMDKLIENPPWSGGSGPSDSDIFTVIFTEIGEGEGDGSIIYSANCTYEDMLAAKEDGKVIQAIIGVGDSINLLSVPQEVGDEATSFMSYLVAFPNEGQMIGVVVTVSWDTTEEEHPIVGEVTQFPLSGGGSGASEYLLTTTVNYTTDDSFVVGTVKDVNGDDVDWDQMVDYITGRNDETRMPITMIAHVINNDAEPNPNFNNYTELKFAMYDSLNHVITFENHTISSNQIIFTQIKAVHSSEPGSDVTSWTWGQEYLSV